MKEKSPYKSLTEWKNSNKKNQSAYNFAYRQGMLPKICKDFGWELPIKIIWTKEKIHKCALECETRKEFQKKYPGGAGAAFRQNIMNEVCSHMLKGNKPKGYWTKNKIHNCALQCKTRTEFSQKFSSAYNAARKLNIIDEVCNHMESNFENWTEEKIYNIFLKYKKRSECMRNDSGAYQTAKRLGILDKVSSHMEKNESNWTKEKLYEKAKLCKSKSDFKKKFPSAYRKSCELNILDEITSHMQILKKKWTKKEIYNLAKECNSKMDFKNKYSKAYEAARRLNILEEVTTHMKEKRVSNSYWTKDKLLKIFLKYKTKTECKKNNPSAFLAAKRLGIFNNLTKHMEYGGRKWTEEKIIKIANKCKTISEFQKKYQSVYNAARNLGILGKIKLNMKPSRPKLDFEICYNTALKYKNISEWIKKSGSTYTVASREGWRDKCTKHMKSLKKPANYWTIENCKKDAKKYKSKGEWRKNSSGAYTIAHKKGWLDICTQHMKPGKSWERPRKK